MKRTTLFIFMLMVLFAASGEAMSFPSGASTYITNISTAADWSEFCATVNGGYDYSGVEVRLTDDITEVSDIVGTSSNCFRGTFDGQNHTITLAIDTTINEAALFRYTNNAFFQNLKLEGYIHSTSGNTASLIGLSQEFVSIVDCHSNVTVSNADDQNGVAGFIAFASDRVHFSGCSFTGVLAGTSSEQNGGFVGRYTNGGEQLSPEPVEGPASYTFTAKTTDHESRFKLVFSASDDADGGNEVPFAFIDASDNIIVMNGPSTGSGTYTLQVIDVMGRVVVCRDAINRVSTLGMSPGVYVLRLINGNDVKTQKIIIQ